MRVHLILCDTPSVMNHDLQLLAHLLLDGDAFGPSYSSSMAHNAGENRNFHNTHIRIVKYQRTLISLKVIYIFN